MDVVVYHNPGCGTSRNTLALLRHQGIEPHVIEYLKTPPSAAMLVDLARRMRMPLRELLREKGTPFRDLGLGDPTVGDEALLAAIQEHPVLINRPIVVAPQGVKLCRPSETVLDLIPLVVAADLDKDDGTPFLRDEQISATDPRLAKALRAARLRPRISMSRRAGSLPSARSAARCSAMPASRSTAATH
ncbi:arsenate reductase (glutaredoxin) [Methylobrevis pamukkalensis]|uniref:Arsenate reductase n=1 Tax=Methylobrevis pamukkalensis TaxID=1439726 RepID=A0A1E3H685_9HYPH|nr:Arsenate reductase [Methylobrevis pamukkalensis]